MSFLWLVMGVFLGFCVGAMASKARSHHESMQMFLDSTLSRMRDNECFIIKVEKTPLEKPEGYFDYTQFEIGNN